jgi:hypothetical protein
MHAVVSVGMSTRSLIVWILLLADYTRVVAGAYAGASVRVDLSELAAAVLTVLAEVVVGANTLPEQPITRHIVLARTTAVEVADE